MSEGMLRFREFRGIDQSRDELDIKEGYSPDLQNVTCEDGCLRVVSGYEKYTSEAVPGGAHSLAAFRSRTNPCLLAANDEGIYSLNGQGSWTLEYSLSGLERIAHLNYAKDGDDIILIAGGKEMLLWDGLEPMYAVAGAPYGTRHLALHYERVWASGKTDEPDTIYWSRAYDPTNWKNDDIMPEAGGGFVLAPTFNGGRVIGVMNLFNDVVIFKDQDIFRIYGTYPGNYEISRVHGIVGPVAERTVAPWSDRVFFFSREGLCVYNGVTAQPIDKGRASRFLDNIDFDVAKESACACIHKDTLRVALPEKGHTANNAILEVDLRRDVWTIRRDIRADDFIVWNDDLLFINDTGHIYTLDKGTSYDGRLIRAYWQSPWMDFGRMGVPKRAGELRALGTGAMLVTQETERSRHVRVMRFGKESLRRVCLRGVGNRLRLRLENLDGESFSLRGGIEWNMELDE